MSRSSRAGERFRFVVSARVFELALLLFDEPLSAFDKHLRGLMQEEVKRLAVLTVTSFCIQ
jgi:ABC-type Fe3+/spermidine/putrescine transport system ATPase subunit